MSRVVLMNVRVIFAVEEPVTAKTRNIRQACVQLRPEAAPFATGVSDVRCDGVGEIRSLAAGKFW